MKQKVVAVAARSMPRALSRRDVLRGLASAGLGLGLARLPDAAAWKKRGKKARPNAFGCLDVGAACRNDAQCCSDVC